MCLPRLSAGCALALWLAGCQTSTKEAPLSSTAPINLQQMLDDAIQQGRHTLVLPRGRFQVLHQVILKNVTDFTLDGSGSELNFPPEGEMLAFAGCRNLTLKGFTVDCAPLPYTQGTITQVADDHQSFEYEVHAGYPLLTIPGQKYGAYGVFVFDPSTRRWRQDVPDIYPTKSEVLSPTHGRVSFSNDLPGTRLIRAGDLVAFKNGGGNAFLFRGCDNVVVQDVTVLTAPLAGFLFRSCSGPIRFTHCRITRGPKPPGATQDRLLSTVADGFNVGYSRQGPVMEDCDFSFMGDDAVNLHGTILDVVAVEDPCTFWIARTGSAEFQVAVRSNDTARVMNPTNFAVKYDVSIAACEVRSPAPELEAAIRQRLKTGPGTRLYFVRFTLTRPAVVVMGDKIEIPEIACPHFVFRNNYFHDHRARGLRLGASHGLIEGNRFERIKSTAICLGPHAIDYEGGWVRDVTVRHNVIREVCFDDRSLAPGSANAGAIVVQHFLKDPTAVYPQENRAITIADNDIQNVGGAGILITSGTNIMVTTNYLAQTQMRDCDQTGTALRLAARAAISLNYSTAVTLRDNVFGPPGKFCRQESENHNHAP